MLLVFTAELPAIDPKNAAQLLDSFAQFNPSLRKRKEGAGYWLTVPSHRVPLRTHRLLKDFCAGRYPHWKWRLYGLDDEGNPTVAITEDSP